MAGERVVEPRIQYAQTADDVNVLAVMVRRTHTAQDIRRHKLNMLGERVKAA